MRKEYQELWEQCRGHKKFTVLGKYYPLQSQEESVDFSNKIIAAIQDIKKNDELEAITCLKNSAESFRPDNLNNACITEWCLASILESADSTEVSWHINDKYIVLARELMAKYGLCYDFVSLDNLFLDKEDESGVLTINVYE